MTGSLLRGFRSSFVVLLAGLTLVGTTAEAGRKKPAAPDVVEDALAFAQTDRARAIKILEEGIAANPNSKTVDLLRMHAGEQRRLSGNAASAHAHFTEVTRRGQAAPELESAKLGLALIDASDGLDPAVLSVLRTISERDVPSTMNADRYRLLAIDAAGQKDSKGAGAHSKRALQFARDDSDVFKRVEQTLSAIAMADPAELPMVATPFGADPLEEAERLYAAGDLEKALKEAERAVAKSEGPALIQAQGLLRVLQSGPADRNKVVVLLPLTGKYGPAGEQVREALNYGYAGGGRTLEFVDSGSTPETAVQALENAVLTKHAIAVVGPVLTDETDAVIAAAERLHVPLLSLSQAYENSAENTWALQAMPTRRDQVEALLDFAMGERKMTSFAVFSPDSEMGTLSAQLFKESVTRRGGRIATEATYAAEEQNLLVFARNLGVRDGNLADLRAKAKAQGQNPDSVVVPPRLDFEGIFIPENAQRTPLACAALAYEEFPMGDFQPTRTSPTIPLLGLSAWNTTSLVAAGNQYTRNSLFPDVFSATVLGDADPFVVGYRAATGRTPTSLEAAIVDAGKLLSVAAKSPASTRGAFLEALLVAKVPDAVTGATSFDPKTRKVTRRMLILTITRTTLEEVGVVPM